MIEVNKSNFLYDAIIFDFDGTLVDSAEIKKNAFSLLYKKYGKEVEERVVKYHEHNEGVPRNQKFKFFQTKILKQNFDEQIEGELSSNFSSLVLDLIVKAPYLDGVEKFLNKYYEVINFFVASATPQKELEKIINKRGMRNYFKDIYGSPKTKGKIIKGIIKNNNLDKKRVLMVGDSISDYNGALEANVKFLGVEKKNNDKLPKGIEKINNFEKLIKKIH